MKKIFLITFSLFLVHFSHGQEIIAPFKEDSEDPQKMNYVYDRAQHNEREKVQLSKIREADMMWSRKIWREIDLRQRVNFPLYYPQEIRKGVRTIDRKNLFDVLYDAAVGNDGKDGESIRVWGEAKDDDEFRGPWLSKSEIEDLILGAYEEVGQIIENRDGEDSVDVNGNLVRYAPGRDEAMAINKKDIKKWRVKEHWFFDKQRSVMDVRIIGLCPIVDGRDPVTKEFTGEEIPLFWVYFPECRKVLKNALAFNMAKNEAENKTYEDIFMKRMFASTIIKEGNVQNRAIADYMVGLDAILEAERIKEEIFNLEHDLWEY
tara:strand:- start:673 stop:1629 length:957 start_codon:yes stop_codon:yes gene_type:complete